MAKIKQWHDYVSPYRTCFLHFGGTARDDPGAWHASYAYVTGLLPIYSKLSYPLRAKSFWTSLFLAQSLASLPAIPRDLCPFCRDSYPYWTKTPVIPRWNIYRGQSREIVIPCILWDCFNPDPPPGFSYYGWAPI